jgi:hypothetical protein
MFTGLFRGWMESKRFSLTFPLRVQQHLVGLLAE